MDVVYFLKARTRMIREYYAITSRPFMEIIRKIDAGEDPYVPPYSEDSEPAFLTEWLEANEMLQVTGRCCLSLLSGSLQLYFKTWERNLGIECGKQAGAAFKKGLVQGYKECFSALPRVDWHSCPVELSLLEQIVLARNRDQHPDNIWTLNVTHAEKDLRRHPAPIFIHEDERGLLSDDEESRMLMNPHLHVSAELLEAAISGVETFCDWLEDQLFRAIYPSYRGISDASLQFALAKEQEDSEL
jgi:hypothetical protein